MGGLPDPAGGSASPRPSPALAALRLVQQLYELPTAAAQAELLVQHLAAAFSAQASLIMVRSGPSWTAAFSPNLLADHAQASAINDERWLERTATALAAGCVPDELAGAGGPSPCSWVVEPIAAGAMLFGAVAVSLPADTATETREALHALARQLAETCLREHRQPPPADASTGGDDAASGVTRRALERRIQELEGLRELSGLARLGAPPADFYRALTERVANLLHADSCVIWEWDNVAGVFRPVGGTGRSPRATPVGAPLPDDTSRLTATIFTTTPVLIHRGAENAVVRRLAEIIEERVGFRMALGVRLEADGQTVGALVVLRHDDGAHFTDDDSRLLEIIAGQAAQELQRFRVTRALQRAFEVRDAVIRHLPDAIVVYNREGYITALNDIARRMTSGVAEEGKHVDEVRAGLNRLGIRVGGSEDPMLYVTQALRDGQPATHRRLTVTRPGRPEQIVDLSSAPILDAKGRVDGAVVVFRDVTQQHEADRRNEALLIELEASEGRFRSIINHLDSAVLVRDQHTVLYTNQKYRELFGLEHDVVGLPVSELTQRVAAYFTNSEAFLGRLIPADDLAADTFSMLVELRYPARRFVERISSPLRGGNGDVVGRLIVYRDLTREHDQMDQRDRFLADTALVLRGDLGLPKGELTRLLAELNDLKARTDGGADMAARIAEVESRIRHVNDEIADVLGRLGILRDLPLAQRGELVIVPERHDLVETALAALQATPGLNPARLSLDGFNAGPVEVWGHRARVAQIVGWIAENAVAYAPPGAPVAARLRRLPAAGCARLEITDRGLGLDPEEAERLFSCYYRSERAVRMKPRGMGVSLYLARETVRLLGGTLWAESRGPGQGATFVLDLPLADEQPMM